LAFSHHAEAVVIDKIARELEWTLKEPFDSAYSQLIKQSRHRVLSAYEQRMGQLTWIHEQPLNQT
jgi:predicted negative regulator of RcsB-dependent stress response